jgi:penicillin-binding protein 1C
MITSSRFSTRAGLGFKPALQWAIHGYIVSGGSTLTMLVARLLEPGAEKSMLEKLAQMLRAVEVEQKTSKSLVL